MVEIDKANCISVLYFKVIPMQKNGIPASIYYL